MLQSAANSIQSAATSSQQQQPAGGGAVKKSQSQNQAQLQGLQPTSSGTSQTPSSTPVTKRREFGSTSHLEKSKYHDDEPLYERKPIEPQQHPPKPAPPVIQTATKTQPKPPPEQPQQSQQTQQTATPKKPQQPPTPQQSTQPPPPPSQPTQPPPPQPPHQQPLAKKTSFRNMSPEVSLEHKSTSDTTAQQQQQIHQQQQQSDQQQIDPLQYNALFETNHALKSELQRLSVYELKCKTLEKEV